jgi:hypothetical protein
VLLLFSLLNKRKDKLDFDFVLEERIKCSLHTVFKIYGILSSLFFLSSKRKRKDKLDFDLSLNKQQNAVCTMSSNSRPLTSFFLSS